MVTNQQLELQPHKISDQKFKYLSLNNFGNGGYWHGRF